MKLGVKLFCCQHLVVLFWLMLITVAITTTSNCMCYKLSQQSEVCCTIQQASCLTQKLVLVLVLTSHQVFIELLLCALCFLRHSKDEKINNTYWFPLEVYNIIGEVKCIHLKGFITIKISTLQEQFKLLGHGSL